MSKTHLQGLRQAVSVAALSLLDAGCLCYIRVVEKEAKTQYALCAADGTQLALFDSYDAAYFTARQHDLDPLTLQ